MDELEFDAIIRSRMFKCTKTLDVKAQEYAVVDRLHNFRRAGAMLGCSPERALVGFLAKHLVSIFDIVDAIDLNKRPKPEVWDEKIGDAINYLLLLDAAVQRKP